MTVTIVYLSGDTQIYEYVRIFSRENADYLLQFNAGYPDNTLSIPAILIRSIRVSR